MILPTMNDIKINWLQIKIKIVLVSALIQEFAVPSVPYHHFLRKYTKNATRVYLRRAVKELVEYETF